MRLSYRMNINDIKELVDQVSVEDVVNCVVNKTTRYLDDTPWYNILKDYVFLIVLYKFVKKIYYYLAGYGLLKSMQLLYKSVANWIFQRLLESPLLRGSVNKEVSKAVAGMEKELIKNDDQLADFEVLPKEGLSSESINSELDKLNSILPHTSWEQGRVSGAVYHGGKELIKLQSEAFEKYCVANQLHPDVFPAVRKMEAEVVSMTLKMFNAPETGCGTTTSGGTESLLLACLSAKVYGLKHRGITEPEMIVPVTAHAGFDKAAYYFGIKIHHVDLDPVTYKVDLKKVKRLINGNTVLLAGSAPNFPHGIVDDIEGLGKLAQKYKIPLHVDCCLGSFIIAFMEKAGFNDIGSFDFRVPGVTSISCDTHKYGFAPKGSSVIMYRNSELRKHQYYVDSKWTGGLYGSPTLAGSRPGALVVGCWSTMIHMGESGYKDSCTRIVSTARKLKDHIRNKLPQLEVLGDPKLSVVSFSSNKLNIYELADRLAKSGWHLNALQKPAALHLAITTLSVPTIDTFIETLTEAVEQMSADPTSTPSTEGTSALYGVAGSVKTTGVADKLITAFLDTLYKVKSD
ncbi:Pyridoxal-dependent decarboxylase conserved domain [Nakaseomyces glabratus]